MTDEYDDEQPEELDIVSPPFSTDAATVPRMLHQLDELRQWVGDQQDWANMILSSRGSDYRIPILPTVPDHEQYVLTISVQDIAVTWTQIRQLRSFWDSLVREFETEWDSDQCLNARVRAIVFGVSILTDAFVPHERREARQQAAARKARKRAEKIMRHVLPPDMFEDFQKGRGSGFNLQHDIGAGDHISTSEIDLLFNPDQPDDDEEDEDPF